MKAKIAKFIETHGYTLRAFLVSGLVFPPAALFIALKHPSWSLLQRSVALLSLVIFLAVIPIVGSAVFAQLYKLITVGLSLS
jgi:predicted branched-subunit amino acid permease